MKRKTLFLTIAGLLLVMMVAGCGEKPQPPPPPAPAPVLRAEFQQSQIEVTGELNKMDSRVTKLTAEVDKVKEDVAEVREDVAKVKEDVKSGLEEVKDSVADVRSDLKSGIADVNQSIKDLARQQQQQPYPYPYPYYPPYPSYSYPYSYPYPYYPPYVVPSPEDSEFNYYFEPGYYRFTIEFEGRLKLYVDGTSVLKAWSSYYRRAVHRTSAIYLSGDTEIRVECAEGIVYRLTWERTDDP